MNQRHFSPKNTLMSIFKNTNQVKLCNGMKFVKIQVYKIFLLK